MHRRCSAGGKPKDNPETSCAVCVSWALLHGVWYMRRHAALQLLRWFIAIAAQAASSTVFSLSEKQQVFFFLPNNKVFYISQTCRALASLAAVIQPNSMSTEEMLLQACIVCSLLALQHTQKCDFFFFLHRAVCYSSTSTLSQGQYWHVAAPPILGASTDLITDGNEGSLPIQWWGQQKLSHRLGNSEKGDLFHHGNTLFSYQNLLCSFRWLLKLKYDVRPINKCNNHKWTMLTIQFYHKKYGRKKSDIKKYNCKFDLRG